jgi:hypothetical protein
MFPKPEDQLVDDGVPDDRRNGSQEHMAQDEGDQIGSELSPQQPKLIP